MTFLLLINLASGFCVNICCHLSGENLITPQRDKAGATPALSWELKFVDILYERALSHLPSLALLDRSKGQRKKAGGRRAAADCLISEHLLPGF